VDSEWLEDCLEAHDMAANVYVALIVEPWCSRQEQEAVSHRSRGLSRSRVPKVDSGSGDQRPSHQRPAG
jgi:hypothetical protein